jgi:hypothetical protein
LRLTLTSSAGAPSQTLALTLRRATKARVRAAGAATRSPRA